ncbi:MAG: hypothetical protein ACR2NP_07730 [Pirellulaceae bacterium]
MAIVALNWDKNWIRIAVATATRGTGRILFDHALAVELPDADDELSTAKLGDKLRAILERVGVHKGEATVIVPRGDLEMRQFELPPVPPDELPDLVRFQARNHFTSFTDDWLLDYLPLPDAGDKAVVLAAAIPGDKVQRIRDTVEKAGLKLRHIVVRPFSAVELLRNSRPSPHCRVVLEPLGRQADISVVDNDYILMTRTVRVPETYTDEQFDAWLPGEIKRTIASAQGQSGAREIAEIVVCSSAEEHRQLGDDLSSAFQIETSFFQPFDAVTTSSRFQQPDRINGFASLLGSLLPSSTNDSHVLDFLNPRKRPEQQVDRQRLTLYGGIAAAVVLIGLVSIWWMFRTKNAEIARLETINANLRVETENTDDLTERVGIVDRWKEQSVDWLEELYQLSQRLPDPDHLRVSSATFYASPAHAAAELKGFLSNDRPFEEVTANLRERPYKVFSPTGLQETRERGFDWEFSTRLESPYTPVPLNPAAAQKPVAPAEALPDQTTSVSNTGDSGQ